MTEIAGKVTPAGTYIRGMRFIPALFVLVSPLTSLCFADPPTRWVPDHCLEYRQDTPAPWNEAYTQGFRAIMRSEYETAEAEMCRALLMARGFEARDWRFAETLDELGLIAYELHNLELAERMQGAAIAEMLLAVGPQGEPLRDHETSEQSPIREDCRSGVRVYTTRLGWILERSPGRTTISELRGAPWRIFAARYLPHDTDLAQRLEWLISRYLLEENLPAADALTELQREIRSEMGNEYYADP